MSSSRKPFRSGFTLIERTPSQVFQFLATGREVALPISHFGQVA
jgi:hypothetical protein